jgi:hypothetical protein
MAPKRTDSVSEHSKRGKAESEPKFPYTTKPSSLRKLLQGIPKKPKPPRFDRELLRSWEFPDSNDYTMIRVLKAVGLVDASNQPTEIYARYMQLDGGSAALAEPIKQVYKPLFLASHTPYSESNEKLKNLFNIHSGGGERTLDQQIQTFRALCENTSFDTPASAPQHTPATDGVSNAGLALPAQQTSAGPAVNINVHIHLPENKSRRDYEAMIEDIGRYIFGRTGSAHRDEQVAIGILRRA